MRCPSHVRHCSGRVCAAVQGAWFSHFALLLRSRCCSGRAAVQVALLFRSLCAAFRQMVPRGVPRFSAVHRNSERVKLLCALYRLPLSNRVFHMCQDSAALVSQMFLAIHRLMLSSCLCELVRVLVVSCCSGLRVNMNAHVPGLRFSYTLLP